MPSPTVDDLENRSLPIDHTLIRIAIQKPGSSAEDPATIQAMAHKASCLFFSIRPTVERTCLPGRCISCSHTVKDPVHNARARARKMWASVSSLGSCRLWSRTSWVDRGDKDAICFHSGLLEASPPLIVARVPLPVADTPILALFGLPTSTLTSPRSNVVLTTASCEGELHTIVGPLKLFDAYPTGGPNTR